jgi:NNP family nitrate/nitrite transporter-like MFS transporter
MNKMEKSRFRWVVLSLSWVGWLLLGTAVLSLGVMLTILIPQLGLTGVQAAILMAVTIIPSVVFAIPIGSLADRFGGRKLGAIGLFMLAVGLIQIAVAQTYTILVIGRFFIGIGSALCGTPLQEWTTRWFPSEELGTALGILSSSYGISGIIGIFAMGWILATIGIYMTAMIFGVLSLIWMVFFLLVRLERPIVKLAESPSSDSWLSFSQAVSKAFRNLELWKLGIAGFAIAGIFTSYATFAPITFVALLNMDIATAAATAGIVSLISFPFFIGGGWISDITKRSRFGRKIVIGFSTLICALAYSLIGIASVFFIALIAIAFIGVFNWLSNAALSAACAESVDKNMAGCALGFLAFISSIGNLVLPLAMGVIFDITGSWALAWTVPAVTAFIGGVVALFSKY